MSRHRSTGRPRNRRRKYTKDTKIIEKSPAYGIPPIVVTKTVDPKVKANLREAFLKIHEDPKGMEIISKIGVDKFIVPDDANYDSVREMDKWLAQFAARESRKGRSLTQSVI
jgi:phosphonate transport system substrate-binding protein